ncbi:hypothetical protein ABBQ32_010650 [Trebouxia sp. C0010 RCD-2024]
MYQHWEYLTAKENQRQVVFWTVVAAIVPAAGAFLWWLSEKSYNNLAPYRYRYRPGSITGYISRVLAGHADRRRRRKPVRVYMDGCFDMMHYGHANALRQARATGDELVVGLVPDREIMRCKGPPVQNEQERKIMVEAVKWVGEVITDVPYELTPDFLEELFTKHRIDYVVHGDDPCLLPDGTDAYAHAKEMGRFKMVKRTEGVSSTDIVGRMLMLVRTNNRFSEKVAIVDKDKRALAKQFSQNQQGFEYTDDKDKPDEPPVLKRDTVLSRFMPTSRRLVQFSDGNVADPAAKIVYIDGAFDLFHVGHIELLKKAKEQGDFLLVGLHTDEDVSERRGPHLPIMDLHERCLSVLACKYVDEAIIGAPLEISEDLITTFNISLVVRGTVSETSADQHDKDSKDLRYRTPKANNMFRQLQSPSDMTTATIISRIFANRKAYEDRNAKKVASEQKYYKSKQHVTEG